MLHAGFLSGVIKSFTDFISKQKSEYTLYLPNVYFFKYKNMKNHFYYSTVILVNCFVKLIHFHVSSVGPSETRTHDTLQQSFV